MEKIIALNHKMNLNYGEVEEYIKGLKKLDLNPIVFPTSIYASSFIENGFTTGLQNIYFHKRGAYTGEISPKQAASLGINYVLIGHPERKELFDETDEEVNRKIKCALDSDLKVILCVGEDKDEDYKSAIKKQIDSYLKGIDREIIIAYEPMWAIGKNIIPCHKKLEEVINYIKSFFNYDVKVLYGGSVNSESIKTLNDVNVVSGYLIGTVSTDINELEKIKEVVK